MSKIIFHLDMDQFFAAVEMLHNPSLRGKPVIVGGSAAALGKGVVTTASYEARKYGVKSGMSALDAIRLCPHAIFLPPDTAKYVEISQRIFEMLLEYTDRVEPSSVDEACMDVTDVVWRFGSVANLAMTIKQRIREQEGLTATIGAGPNRLVAKLASGMQKPDGFTHIPAERIAEVFRDLPVGDLCGVGRATQEVLEGFGIRTAGQLGEFPVEILKRRFGVWGEELSRIGRGEASDKVLIPVERPQEKSMGHEHTFSRDYTDPKILLGRLHLLCERVARRLRAARLVGCTVTVRVRYHGFETVLHGHKLKRFLQHEMDIFPVAEKLFHECYQPGQAVRLVGVSVSELLAATDLRQQDMFITDHSDDQLTHACDEIKDRFGEHAIGFASGVFLSGGRLARSKRAVFYRPFHHQVG